MGNGTDSSGGGGSGGGGGGSGSGGGGGISGLMIPLYILIFLLAVLGNSLVLATLFRNKRMRTVTNVYLLNLAVSDLLLGVFCMPFTLIGQLLRNFIFGPLMCSLISYFQAVSVSVAVWTLVAISLERYFAICRPLKSRRWQTQFHAYKMIALVWILSLLWNAPILYVTRLKTMRDKGRHKCREEWPSQSSRLLFNLFLDCVLLLIPLLVMSLAYSLIVNKLWKGLQRELKHSSHQQEYDWSGWWRGCEVAALAGSPSSREGERSGNVGRQLRQPLVRRAPLLLHFTPVQFHRKFNYSDT